MTKHYLNRITGMGAWVVAFLFLCLPVAWGQEELTKTFYVDDGAVAITENGTYRVAQRDPGTAMANTITVQEGLTVTVYLKDVNISSENSCPFDIQGDANVTLMLEGVNTLTTTASKIPALRCEGAASLTIDGKGELVATSDDHVAGIGGGDGGSGGTITISGGVVTAKGDDFASGIGDGSNKYDSEGGIITIGDGVVIATNGIGGWGYSEENLKFNKGIIFDNNSGKVYGTPTLPAGVITIPAGKTLVVETGKTLSIGTNTTLIVEGTITNNGTITNEGVLAVAGTLTNNTEGNTPGKLYSLGSGFTFDGSKALMPTAGVRITFDGNGGVTDFPSVQVVEKDGDVTEPDEPRRAGYTFKCWSESEENRDEATLSAAEDKAYYAVWQYNPVIGFSGKQEYTYGEAIEITAKALIWKGTEFESTEITLGELQANIGTHTITATYTPAADDDYNVTTTATYTYTINKATLGADDFTFETPTDLEYNGLPKEATVTTTKEGVENITPTYYKGEEEVDAPISAGTYTVKVSATGGTNYEDVTDLTDDSWTFVVSKKEITVTPDEEQILFKGWTSEDVKYTLADVVETDNGKLSVTGFEVEEKEAGSYLFKAEATLSLEGEAKDNYTLKPWTGEIPVIVYADKAADEVEAILPEGAPTSGWTKEPVTLTAPAGFEFTNTEGSEALSSPLTLSEDAAEPTYYLRVKGAAVVHPHSLAFGIDKTAPEVAIATDGLSFTLTPGDATSGIASVAVDGADVSLTDGVYTSTGTEGEHKVVVTDNAGNSTGEVSFTLTAPVTYQVSLRQTSGGTIYATPTVAEAGTTITLSYDEDTDYDFAGWTVRETANRQPVSVNGNTFTMPASDVTVSARFSYDPPYVPDPDPVANETIEAATIEVRGGEGGLYLRLGMRQEVGVYTFTGSLLRRFEVAPGDSRWTLPTGNYIVRIDGKSYKVAVR